jgi:hypothetical protein
VEALNEDWEQEAALDQAQGQDPGADPTWAQPDPFADEVIHGRGGHMVAAAAAAAAEREANGGAGRAAGGLREELAEYMAMTQGGAGGGAGGAGGGAGAGADGRPKVGDLGSEGARAGLADLQMAGAGWSGLLWRVKCG